MSGKITSTNQKSRTIPTNQSGSPNTSTFQSKPRLLGLLEDYLDKELKLLSKDRPPTRTARLQAYREVFEHLIGEFNSFKPILSSVKQEYDSYISHLEEQAEQLDPLKLKMQLLIEENEKKLLSIQNVEKEEILDLQNENTQLRSTINNLRESNTSLECKLATIQKELSSQYILYRNEADARKIAISDLSQMKNTQQPEDQVLQKEDPVVLRIALKQSREDLKKSQRKLTQLVMDYGDVIPRKDYDDVITQLEGVKESFEELKQDFTTLNMEQDMLQESYKLSLSEKQSVSQDLERLKGSATPRPLWDRCAGFFEDGKWSEMTENTSSAEKVDILLVEVSGLSLEEIRASDKFQGLGLEENIPKFLRCEGEVNNIHMSKQKAYMVLSGFWPYRVQQLVNNENVSLDVSLYSYLCESQSEERVYELAYNIHHVLAQYEFQLLPGLMLDILMGKREEEIYFELLARHDILKSHLTNLATSEEDCNANISKEDLLKCIVSTFSVFNEELALKVTNGIGELDPVPADELTKQLGEGTTEFLELFYECFLQQRSSLIKDITNKLSEFE
eukprot:TRINITY_DN290_c0_g4_i4.p1 TRINITY_DN290_c0_g4~~TRINITY_DN290_c0_g4_i4.p1  ORF type:complete len:563 (+),score=155.98 TRINITY_DN290_c0_g4_i4:178-1866(+)